MYGGPGLTDEFLDPQVKGASVPNAFVSHEGQQLVSVHCYEHLFCSHTSEIIHANDLSYGVFYVVHLK